MRAPPSLPLTNTNTPPHHPKHTFLPHLLLLLFLQPGDRYYVRCVQTDVKMGLWRLEVASQVGGWMGEKVSCT